MTHMLGEKIFQEAKNMLARLSNQEKIIKYAKLDFRRDSGLVAIDLSKNCSKQFITETFQ